VREIYIALPPDFPADTPLEPLILLPLDKVYRQAKVKKPTQDRESALMMRELVREHAPLNAAPLQSEPGITTQDRVNVDEFDHLRQIPARLARDRNQRRQITEHNRLVRQRNQAVRDHDMTRRALTFAEKSGPNSRDYTRAYDRFSRSSQVMNGHNERVKASAKALRTKLQE